MFNGYSIRPLYLTRFTAHVLRLIQCLFYELIVFVALRHASRAHKLTGCNAVGIWDLAIISKRSLRSFY